LCAFHATKSFLSLKNNFLFVHYKFETSPSSTLFSKTCCPQEIYICFQGR
jgi:hypothetical protein